MSETRTSKSAILSARKPSVTRVSGRSGIGSPVQKVRPLFDPAALAQRAQQASQQALAQAEESGRERLKAGKEAGLRFMQFLRAYMKAFAAGFACYLLLGELVSGHFNIFAMIAMHLFSIVAAPFYALVLAPTAFGLYRGFSALGLPLAMRAYAVAALPGAMLVLGRLLAGRMMLVGDWKADAVAAGMLLCGAVAGYTFNRAVAQIQTASELPAGATA